VYDLSKTNLSLWSFPLILEAGVKIWFYSGEADPCINTVWSEEWIAQMVGDYNIPLLRPIH